jgi:hypothetical protein
MHEMEFYWSQSQSGDGENMQDMSVDFAWSSKPTNID